MSDDIAVVLERPAQTPLQAAIEEEFEILGRSRAEVLELTQSQWTADLDTYLQMFQAALTGTLASPSDASCVLSANGAAQMVSVTFGNNMPIPVSVFYLAPPGITLPSGQTSQGGERLLFFNGIPPKQTSASMTPPTVGGAQAVFRIGQCFVVTSTATGGVIGVVQVPGPGEILMDCALTLSPNMVGQFPAPNSSLPIPPDSPRIVVACGPVKTSAGVANGYMLREQFWERQHDSYTLAPFEKRNVSLTTTAGKQETSSKRDSVAASLGLSASAGWGPVSASVSSSLSVESNRFQQVTVYENVTTNIETEIHNRSAAPATYFRWQLTDIVTVFNPGMVATPSTSTPGNTANAGEFIPAASIVSAQTPSLIDGPYNPVGLPSPPALYQPTVSPLQVLTPLVKLSCGSPASSNGLGSFNSDSISPYNSYYGSGTGTWSVTTSIDTTLVPSTPTQPPMSLFQNCRSAASMTYTIPGLSAGKVYLVTLLFAENWVNSANKRKFNVNINTVPALTNFDVFNVAGAQFKGIACAFNTVANKNGQIVINFSQTSPAVSNPIICGIVVAGRLIPA